MKAGFGWDSQLSAQVDSGLRWNVQSAKQVDLGFDNLDPRRRRAEIHLPQFPWPNENKTVKIEWRKTVKIQHPASQISDAFVFRGTFW